LDLFVAGGLGWDVNCNVSVGLRECVVNLVGKLEDVVFYLALRLEGRQEDLLDHSLEVSQPILRLSICVCLSHSASKPFLSIGFRR